MKLINLYMQEELEALHRHAVTFNNIHCLHVCKGVSMGKNCLQMDIVVTNSEDLNDLYECSKKDHSKDLNRLSQIMTDFFKQQAMGVRCGLSVKEEVTFKIVLQKNVYEKVKKKLNDQASRSTDDNTGLNKENVHVSNKKTLICHLPKELQNNAACIQIVGDHPQDFKALMHPKPNNMYMIDIQIAANCDTVTYSYEVELINPKRTFFRNYYTQKYTHFKIRKSDGNVIRDIFNKPEDICAHLYDVIVYNQERFNYGDLMLWSNEFCKHMSKNEAKDCAMSLMSYDIHGKESTIRLVLIIYQLSFSHSVNLKEILRPDLTKHCIEYLRHRKLSDFPRDYQLFFHEFCKCLYYLLDTDSSCTFDFIDKFWSFYKVEGLLEILEGEVLRSQKTFIRPECVTQLMVRGKELIEMLVEENDNVLTEILKIFILQCPSEFVSEFVCELKEVPSSQDLLLDIHKYTHLHFCNALQIAKRNNHLIELLRIATKAVKLEDKYGIKDEFENTLTGLFSSFQDISVDELLNATVDCLNHSLCFDTAEGQDKLIKAILESRSQCVWCLFPRLFAEKKLSDTFMHLDKLQFKAWFGKELRGKSSSLNEDKIVFRISNIVPVLKSSIIKQREEVYCALKEAFSQWIKRFSTADVIKSIPNVDRIIADLLTSIIDVFFTEELKQSVSEVFIFLTKHVTFLTVLRNGTGKYLHVIQENQTYQDIEQVLETFATHFKSSDLSLKLFKFIHENHNDAKTVLKLSGMTDSEFEEEMQNYKDFMTNTNEDIADSLDTAKTVKNRKITNAPNMNYVISSVTEIKKAINTGSVTFNQCVSFNPQWAEFKWMMSICTSLHSLVKSEVFWNVSTDAVLKKGVENNSPLAEDRRLLYVRFMFEDGLDDIDFDKMEGIYNEVDFLLVMRDKGQKLYSEFWEKMDTDPHIKMADITNMFKNSNVPNEVQLACKILERPKDTKANDALIKMWETKNIIPATNAIDVLADQLKKFSCSSFFKVCRIADMIEHNVVPTIRSNLVKSIIEVSRDFSTRSVNACRTEQDTTVSYAELVEASTKDIATSAVNRTSGMIRWEESNHLIFVFHNQNIQTLSVMYRDKDKLPKNIYKMFEMQMNKPLPNYDKMKQSELRQLLQRVARYHKTPLTEQQLVNMSTDYALTPDNLLKMVLIMMRVLSRVPVVIMGETGCGKTSLIRYLAKVCDVPFQVMNIHAGTNPADVIYKIKELNTLCRYNLDKQYWLFLDEINTSEAVGLICSSICHHRCCDIDLMPNLIIMGACNPYKLRTAEAIKTAGLAGKVKTDDLSKLTYRVLPLPEMMIDYVWDFGSLSEEDEILYIERMVEDVFSTQPDCNRLLCKLLSASQKFVREQEASTCVVSLRDVQRCKTLVCWFDHILRKKNTETGMSVDKSIKAIILALAHCYHCRFMDKSVRRKYIKVLSKTTGGVSLSTECIHSIIKEEQTDILDRMDLPPGIAKNSALKENIFVLLVCILNRIPVFLVGKPGCSKSLAMQVIRSNLRGKDSKNDFFKTLPQLYCVSFQGSESSTSDGIKKVFGKAENYQKSNSKDDVLSVVLLDEIGLAEVSRFNPLKVLHSLLEPDGNSRPNVAVVGISNWALDASKMNRAIHLSRPDMDEDELVETAISITHSFNETVKSEQRGLTWNSQTSQCKTHNIDEDLRFIAQSYISYTRHLQHKHFHGLRDFYSLVKFVARKVAQVNDCELNTDMKTSIILEGLQRNFGGLQHGHSVTLEHFQRCLKGEHFTIKSCGDLVGENINDLLARHLMVITKGESVMDIIERNISKLERERTEIIYGSQFEEDLTDDYSYRILSKIILCMEQGIVLILKDLDYIYGSLYDMLNQNYTRIGNKNNCRVALGPYSNPFCHVDEKFRCIVIVEENELDYSDPPFLNRFEKQYLTFSDTLKDNQKSLVKELFDWVRCLTIVDGMPFSELTAFPYFNYELLVSLVLYYEKFSQSKSKPVLDCCKHALLWLLRPEVIFRLEKISDPHIVQSRLDLEDEYFNLPIHNGLGYFIAYQKEQTECLPFNKITFIFTSSNIHTDISQELTVWKYVSLKIGAFKSEKRLSTTLKQFWEDHEQEILLVHCNAAEDGKHLMLTKSLIEKFCGQCKDIKYQQMKRVYIIIHMNVRVLSENAQATTHSESVGSISQINFLSGCQLVLLDSLERPKQPLTLLRQTTLLEMTELFVQNTDNIRNALFWSFTRIKYGEKGRNADSVNAILSKMMKCKPFIDVLASIINEHLKQTLACSNDENLRWFVLVACNSKALVTCSSLVNALEEHIKSAVVTRLAKYIFGMERIGILDSFFVDDDHVIGRRSLWINLLSDENLFCIDEIPDPTGPECFFCDTSDLSLKMPFSSIVFSAIEKTKDIFMDCVARAKLKCDIEPDDELPEEVLTEIMYHHEVFVEPVIPLVVSKDVLESYPPLCDDYITDFCNMFSNNILSHLNCQWRIFFTKWLIVQRKEMCNEEFYNIASHFHSIGWIHYSNIYPALQLLELYFDFIEKSTLQAVQLSYKTSRIKPISSFSNSYVSNISLKNEQKINVEYHKGSTEDNECETEEVSEFNDVVECEYTPIQCSDFDLPLNSKLEFLTIDEISSLEAIESYVSRICLQMLKTFANESTRQWIKIFIAIAREVSDVLLVEKLRLCDAIATYFIDFHGLELGIIRPLINLLEDTDVDSDDVFQEIKTILNLIDHEQSKTSKSRTMCQYLFRCMSSNSESRAFRFLLNAVTDNIIPEKEYGLMKYPLQAFMEDTDFLDIICLYDRDHQYIERSPFFMELDKVLSELRTREEPDNPFIMLVVDIIEKLINLPDDDSYSELISKAGFIVQKNSCPVVFLTAVAFLKSTMSEIGKSVSRNDEKYISQLTVLNGVINGLEENPICHSLKLYFLKILGQTATLHCIQKKCISLSKSFSCLTELQWSQQFWCKVVEYNSMAMYVSKKNLKKGEMLACQTEHFENIMDDLKTIIQERGYQGKLLLFSLAMSEYYTKRHHSVFNDDLKRQADKFCEIAMDSMKSTYEKKMLLFLIGREDFPNDCFQLHEVTSFQQYMINSSLVSFYCLMLGKWNGCHKQRSLLLKCLLCPSEIVSLHKPSGTVHMEQLEDAYPLFGGRARFVVCSCNNRLLLKREEPFLCPICGKGYEVYTHTVHSTSESYIAGRHCKVSTDSLRNRYFVGHMSALSYHIYQFMIKSALLGSLQLDTSNTQYVEKLLSVSEIDLYSQLYSEVKDHWINICFLTNLNDYELGQLVHRIFKFCIDVIFEYNFQFENSDATLKWEQSFDNRVSKLVRDNIGNIHQHQQHYEEVYQLPKPHLESQIRELDSIDVNSKLEQCNSLPSLFRLTKKPTKQNFMQLLISNKQKYPWLTKVMLLEENIKLPQHLCSLMHWHITTCIKVSFSFSKWECTDMSVREFIDKQDNSIRVQKMFTAFKSSVALLKTHLSADCCIDIPDLNENTKLQECLMTDKKSWLHMLVTKLVTIQNEFIDFCLLSSFDCKPLQFLLRDENSAYIRSVSINELKLENLITMTLDDANFDDLLTDNSCAELAYGRGHIMKYDFHNIEKVLVYDLLCEGQRSYITLSGLQFIVFKDELYRSFVSLLNDVTQCVKQEQLPVEISLQIERINSETPDMASKFINHLDMIMTLLKRTKCQADTPLNDYVQTFKHMIGHDFSMNFLSSSQSKLKICHIVSLHELLEELSIDRIIGCLEEKYMKELSKNLQHHFRSLTKGQIPRAKGIVKALKKFIYRCIYMCRTTPDGSLHEIIIDPSFWTESLSADGTLQTNVKTEELNEIFPSEVEVHHAVRIVQLLEENIKAQSEDDVKLDNVISAWKQHRNPAKTSQGKKVGKQIKKL
ncbi:hypothetical protein ACF0H5_002103 [Mactra antiquata]